MLAAKMPINSGRRENDRAKVAMTVQIRNKVAAKPTSPVSLRACR